jgi:replication factor A2
MYGAPYDGAGRYDGAANANTLFSGGGFMPSQATAAPESSGGGFSKVLPNLLQFV